MGMVWMYPHHEENAGIVLGRLAFSDSDQGTARKASFLTSDAPRQVTSAVSRLGRYVARPARAAHADTANSRSDGSQRR